MLVKSIDFPCGLEGITDIEDDNVDVFVELEEKSPYTYIVVVGTAKNLETLMEKENLNYFEVGHPFIIVKKLTKEIIEETIQAYAKDNAYWLKLHHFADQIDPAVFDKLQTEHIAYLKELDDLDHS